MPTLLFLSGSIRKDSFNTKLCRAAHSMATAKGADATLIDLAKFDMPLYNGDLESSSGLPANAITLKELFANANGFFIASPEYNGSFSALLKNTIDWISRPHEDQEQPLIAFKGKAAALAATSPGALGGLRGLVPLRMLLGNIGVIVAPTQFALGGAMKAFDDNGNLVDEQNHAKLEAVVDELIKIAS